MHMLVIAVDYKKTGRPLTCTADARNIEELATQCGVHWLVTLYDEQCTKQAVLDAIHQIGSACGPDDYFIFHWAGHGTNLSSVHEEHHGDEQAFVCLDRHGQVSPDTLLTNDEFRRAVLEAFTPDVRIVILADCCHSGTVVDLSHQSWTGRQAISIAGYSDSQHAEDTAKAGIFTHSLLLAIDKLSKVGRDNYSAGMLFNAILHEDELVFYSKQDITIQSPSAFSPDMMAWPLVPPLGYKAPLNRCIGPGGVRTDAAVLGLSPALLKHVNEMAVNVPVSIEEYIALMQGQAPFSFKPCRGCSAVGSCSAGQCVMQ